jgi:SAM-dependent methyltransferase
MGTSTAHSPQRYRDIWLRKPGLRAVYEDIYKRMLEACIEGSTLEIGCGSGNFKAFAPSAIATDLIQAPWLDVVCDAQRLPFAAGAFCNVAMVDVLHHIEHPTRALSEIARILRPGGRLVMCEPAITPLSHLYYRLFHSEPVDMSANPLSQGPISTNKDPFDSNQAYPTLLVGRFREAVALAVPELNLSTVERLSFLAYPLSGGFRSWSLLPTKMAQPLLTLEWGLRHLLGPLAALRLIAVYERR